MTSHDMLERELVTWFGEIATPSVPDYTDDIVRATAGQRQRPSWAFAERWLPMPVDTLHRVPSTSIPWRTIGLLAVIAALLVSLVVLSIGSRQRRSAEPFGLAANGPAAYATGGDIWVVDPATGTRRAVVTGPEMDTDPRWSPDGTRIAFLRLIHGVEHAVVVAADGSGPAVVTSRTLGNADPDGFKWAPDSRTLVAAVDHGGMRALLLIDADTGAVTTLPVDFAQLEAFWRPPDGGELLFASGSTARPTLTVYSLDTGVPREVPIDASPGEELRPMGWTPDGRRLLVNRWSQVDGKARTFVVDPDTGQDTVLDVGYGHVSNAGDRVAGVREGVDEAFCIVAIDGGPCQGVGRGWAQPGGPHFTTLQWSPDDRWILVYPLSQPRPVLFDATTGTLATDADWVDAGVESWRRDAP